MRSMLKFVGYALAVLGVGLVVLWVVLQRADGPTGPIRGGEFRTGAFVDGQVDWNAVLGAQPVAEVELQLVDPPGSRVTGAFVHDGDLYVPCDLGYLWRRVPDPTMRRVLHLIWLFKGWHEDALRDGRVVLRIEGKRYKRQAVRVTDPTLLAGFRSNVAGAAAEFFGGLLEIETDPDDIWFFRLDPRS